MLRVILSSQSNMIECADLVEVRKKYFEEKSLYLLFRNVDPEKNFDFLTEVSVYYKVRGVLYRVCVKRFDREVL